MAAEHGGRAINRLESRKKLRPMLDMMYDSGLEAAKAGKPVAWCMVNWWEGDPILKAMDVAAIYPENYGTVCAAMGAAQEYLGRSEGEEPRNTWAGARARAFPPICVAMPGIALATPAR
jgi:hypothetical protein